MPDPHGHADPAAPDPKLASENAAAAAHAPVSHAPASHEHGEMALGPIDWPAWLAGAIGVVGGAITLLALYLGGR